MRAFLNQNIELRVEQLRTGRRILEGVIGFVQRRGGGVDTFIFGGIDTP